MVGEDLKDFPVDTPNIDNCSRLVLDENKLTSLDNVRCLQCDFISVNDNNFTELTARMLSGFPNVKKIQANNNQIKQIELDVLKGLRGLDIENNPVEDIPWDHADTNLKVSLGGTRIPCSCAMKHVVDHGVVIKTPPSCKGHPDIPYRVVLDTVECSQVEEEVNRTWTSYPPTTGTLRFAVLQQHLFAFFINCKQKGLFKNVKVHRWKFNNALTLFGLISA